MGQATSSVSTAEAEIKQLHGKLAANFNIIKSLATVSHTEVVRCIEELNAVTRSFTDRGGRQLRFLIKKGTDSTFLWKGTIRIRCLKINTSTSTIESSRLLTLRQFAVMYKEITEQVSLLSQSPVALAAAAASAGTAGSGCHGDANVDDPACCSPVDASSCSSGDDGKQRSVTDQKTLETSAFFSDSMEKPTESEEEDCVTECCVCMDRKSTVMLSCCHEFCEVCIDSWTRDTRHSNCPLCRSVVAGSDDTWILTDRADTTDYDTELKGYLVGLADRPDDGS